MNFASSRPRNWVPGFDTAHLVIPALILAVGLLIAVLPGRPITRSRTVPPAPERILPTTILSPIAGAGLTSGQTVVIEGLAQPGGIVRLYWYANPIGEPTQVGATGRWQFTLTDLPPGTHSIRAGALVAGRNIWSSEVVFTATAPVVQPAAKPSPAPKSRKSANTRR